MGSESSKGSESSESGKRSSGDSNIDMPKVYNAIEHAADINERGFQFREVACWARALTDKNTIETWRVIGSIVTLGLGEISRATVGSANHWAFVARGTSNIPKYVRAVFSNIPNDFRILKVIFISNRSEDLRS